MTRRLRTNPVDEDITGPMSWADWPKSTPAERARPTRTMVRHRPDERVVVLPYPELDAIVTALRERLLRGYDAATASALQRISGL